MTVSTEISHNEYLGNGITTSFPYTFRIFKDSNLDVSTVTADGLVTPMILGTDYTVTGVGSSAGGSVVTSAPVLSGITISITRNLPAVQETDLRNQGKFFAEVHEDAFDYLTMLIQHAIYNVGVLQRNTLRVPESSVNLVPKVSDRRNMIFGWNDSGQPIAVLPPSASASEVMIILAQPDGWKKIGGVDKFEPIPITVMSSYNQSNVVAAWVESVNLYGYVYFPCHSATKKTYTIPGTASQAGNLQNSRVIVDKNVILKFDSDLYSLYKSLKFEGECTFEFSHLNFKTTGGETSYLAKQATLNRDPIRMKRVEWADCKVYSVNGDVFTLGGIASSNDTAAIFSVGVSTYTGLFAPIAVGEEISAHIRMESGVAAEYGLMLRCSGGWMLFYGAPGATQWSYKLKTIGGAVVNGSPFSIPSGLLSYSPGKTTIGVALQSKNFAQITMNGVGFSVPYDTSTVGDIYEAGFIALTASASASARVTGLCSYISRNGIHGKTPLNILIHGDSTAEDFISSFSSYLPQLMDGANGTRSYSIVNKAVAGQTMRQQLDLLKAQGAGSAYIVIMVAGTNEGQANVSGDYMASLVDEFVLYCTGIGRVPVWVEPYMWYSQSFIGGAGQPTANYDGVAEVREAGKRQMMKYGNNAICVSTTHQLPAPLPEYFGSQYDPLLRDDIHQSQLGYRLYAEIICSAIIDWWSRIDYTPRAVVQWWAGTNVTVQTPSSVSRNSLNVKIAATSFANGNAVLTLPRWCRPPVTKNVPVPFTADGTTFGMAMATINASTGVITIVGSTSTTPTFYINASWE